MHVLIVTDQHPDSLGGVQVAIRLQRKYLEALGHRVSIAAPALARPGYVTAAPDREAYIDLPARPITRDREYGITWPGARTDRFLAAALAKLPPVDVVHLQGDFWGALIGIRAARGVRAPLVLTMHNHVDEGTRAVTPFAPVAFWGLRAWRFLALGRARGSVSRRSRGAWRYLAELAAEADEVTAPSAHFAALLERRGVADAVAVTPGGVDDLAIAAALIGERPARTRPRFVWLGRMSQEKRVLEFVSAIAESGVDADFVLHGAGLLLPKVAALVESLGLSDRVTLAGPVPYAGALAAMRDADALVQTSIGFETQGLTPFEAAALGTPTVFCDPEIAADVDVDVSWVASGPEVSDLADALRVAAGTLAAGIAAGAPLRVSEGAGQAFLQSQRVELMLEAYERALGRPVDRTGE